MDKQKVLEFLKKHWPLILALVVGIGVGYGIAPTKVKTIEKEHVVEKTVEKKVVDETLVQAEVEKRVKEIEANMERKVVRVVVTKPDGTKVEKETTDTKVTTKEKDTTDKTTDTTAKKTETVEKVVYVDKVVEKIVDPVKPQWKVGLLVGFAPRFDNLAASPIMLQLQGSRRIAGPFFLTAALQAGSLVTGFQVSNAAVFLGAGLEF